MLLQALAEYADHYLSSQLNDAAWEEKPVPWTIEISHEGTFIEVVPRMTLVTRGGKQQRVPMRMSVPRSPVNRNKGEHPLLGTDDIVYVLGAGPWTPGQAAEKDKAEKHHQAFVALLQRAATATGDNGLASCSRFYDNAAEVEKARAALPEAKSGALLALSAGGALVERAAVQSFWRQHYQGIFAERMKGNLGQCLISGKLGAIAPTHEKIKGAVNLGGQSSGVSLMSFDKESFRSYGWERNENSPVSPDRAFAYVLALNDLLQPNEAARVGNGRRIDIAGVGFLTWLRDPADFDVFEILERADPCAVEALLNFRPGVDTDPNRFYLLGVSANGGRLRVRYWATELLAVLKQNLKSWHEQLRVSYPWDDPPPIRLWQLLHAIHREGKPSANLSVTLMRRAIEGAAQPLGYSILAAVLNRLRHRDDNSTGSKDKKSDPLSLPRLRIPMGLIRMCLNDIARSKGENEMGEGLDPSCALPAYVCGRLIAEFDGLERAANDGGVNSSVLDRYFAMASTCPALAFRKIKPLAQKHLRKLKRNRTNAAYAIGARLRELRNLLPPSGAGGYPAKLSLEGQGLFALGYYHQKAWSMAQAIDRKHSQESASVDAEQED